jgi:hypothetical protein
MMQRVTTYFSNSNELHDLVTRFEKLFVVIRVIRGLFFYNLAPLREIFMNRSS